MRPGRAEARAAGFTLIELMIAVAILGILMESFIAFSHAVRRQGRIVQARTEVSRAATTLDLALGRDIRSSSAVLGKYKEFSASDRCLILDAPRVSPSGRLQPGGGDRIVYHLDPQEPSRLVKRVFPAPGSRRAATRQLLAANVRSIKFSGPEGARLVAWEAEFGATVDRRDVSRRFSSAAGLRRAGL